MPKDLIQLRPFVLVALILAAALSRLVPHPMNFAPIAAMGLFGGAWLTHRWAGFVAPMAALLLSDFFLGFYDGMWVVYLALAASVVIGWGLRAKKTPLRIVGSALAGSVLFFVVTNFAVWAMSGMYPHTGAGLVACYVAAIPFFGNTLAGDLFYAAVLFGGFALLQRGLPALREPVAVAA